MKAAMQAVSGSLFRSCAHSGSLLARLQKVFSC